MGWAWLVAKSPSKLADERARALREAARASQAYAKAAEQGRADMQGHAQELTVHLREALGVAKGVGHVGRDVRAVGAEVQSVGRKVDAVHESVEEFLARAAAGAFGPGPQEELRQALEAVQSVNLVGQDVRMFGKELAALRDQLAGVLEDEQQPRQGGRHRKTGDGGQQAAGPEAGEPEGSRPGAGPGQAGLRPDEEERWLR
jgi:hypothetical protein